MTSVAVHPLADEMAARLIVGRDLHRMVLSGRRHHRPVVFDLSPFVVVAFGGLTGLTAGAETYESQQKQWLHRTLPTRMPEVYRIEDEEDSDTSAAPWDIALGQEEDGEEEDEDE